MPSIEDIENQSAQWFHLPDVPLVGVEHPYMISDIRRAIDTLGGPLKATKVKQFSLISLTSLLVGEASATVEAHLHFHPGDRNSRPVASFNTKTSNILLRISVPKRTGRKRRRGSEDPWQEASGASTPGKPLLSVPEDARRLVGCMQDHPDTYHIEPIATIAQTHRFRRKIKIE
ncbi:MAG: hypothetical protein Q9208_005191 [Pyrenodesmia sp. 3 TL-2023]